MIPLWLTQPYSDLVSKCCNIQNFVFFVLRCGIKHNTAIELVIFFQLTRSHFTIIFSQILKRKILIPLLSDA